MKKFIDNIDKNKNYYDTVYKKVNVTKIINKIQAVDAFLRDAIATDTTWRSLYEGNFQNYIVDKRVL